MNKIQNGWVFEACFGAICRFEHFSLSKAEEMKTDTTAVFVVETINWTFAEDHETVHHNQYFAVGLPSAITLASKIIIETVEVAEDVTCIRKATAEETQQFLKVSDHFDAIMPQAITDQQAGAL